MNLDPKLEIKLSLYIIIKTEKMKKVGKYLAGILAIGLIVGCIEGCNKDGGTSRMYVKMKDVPGPYQQVNVDIKGVEIHYSDSDKGSGGWVSLPTNAGVYDLLTLQNNVTAVLTNPDDIPAGKVQQMRLILGTSNSLMIDSLMFPLSTPSAQNTGLKFNLNFDFLRDKSYEVRIDFDAQNSIILNGHGGYSLKPVIKVDGIIKL
jgi:hypothetical protein